MSIPDVVEIVVPASPSAIEIEVPTAIASIETEVPGPKGEKGDRGPNLVVSSTPPTSPALGDVWIDISGA